MVIRPILSTPRRRCRTPWTTFRPSLTSRPTTRTKSLQGTRAQRAKSSREGAPSILSHNYRTELNKKTDIATYIPGILNVPPTPLNPVMRCSSPNSPVFQTAEEALARSTRGVSPVLRDRRSPQVTRSAIQLLGKHGLAGREQPLSHPG